MKTKLTLIMLIAGFICAQSQTWTWSEDQLSYARDGLSATVLDDSIFYSGGRIESGVFVNIIDIYDVDSNVWDIVVLPTPARWQTSAVSGGGKVFFAGGNDFGANDLTYDVIDVYDKETDEWSVEDLSEARSLIATVAAGNKVFFAGGWTFINPYPGGGFILYNEIDIYDIETDSLSVDSLSVPRCMIGAATAGSKVFFAGGNTAPGEVTDVVDIYDINTGVWTVDSLSVPRAYTAAVAYEGKVYFAGGTLPNETGSDVIDIYNVEDEGWEDPETLSEPRVTTAHMLYNELTEDTALVFTGMYDYMNLTNYGAGTPNGIVDIYYPETGEWDYSVPDLSPSRYFFAHTSYDNRAYYAGGQLGEYFNTINILRGPTVGISEDKLQESSVRIYPNPFTSTLRVDFNLQYPGKVNIAIYNNIGEQLAILMNEYRQQGDQQLFFNAEKLDSGIYFCVLKSNEGIQTKKIVKL